MYIRAADGSWEYTGIGWRVGTNHDHLNIDLRYDPVAVTEPYDGLDFDTSEVEEAGEKLITATQHFLDVVRERRKQHETRSYRADSGHRSGAVGNAKSAFRSGSVSRATANRAV
jgi:hypothetical protein